MVEDPRQQTLLQINPETLYSKVRTAPENIVKRNIKHVVIYCNSISTIIH